MPSRRLGAAVLTTFDQSAFALRVYGVTSFACLEALRQAQGIRLHQMARHERRSLDRSRMVLRAGVEIALVAYKQWLTAILCRLPWNCVA